VVHVCNPRLGRPKQEDYEFEASLSYIPRQTYSPIMGEFRRHTTHHQVRNKFVKRALTSLSSVIAHLCKPNLILCSRVTELGNINAVRISGPPDGGGQMVALSCQRQGNGSVIGSRIKATVRIYWPA
jgi:hypothetical protein